MTKPDYSSVVEALEQAIPALRNSVSATCGDDYSGFEDRIALDKCEEALPLARSMVEKLEQYDELVEAKEALEWLLNNSVKHWDFNNSQRLIINCTDGPAIIKKRIEKKL